MLCFARSEEVKKRGRDIKDAWPPNLGEGHFRDCGDLGAISRIRSLPHLRMR